MTDIIANQIQIELNKLKFFAKRLQHKLNIPRATALNLIANRYFNVDSWSFAQSMFFSESSTHQKEFLVKMGAYNFAYGANHISNFAYAFRYWIAIGKPSAYIIQQNAIQKQLDIFRDIFLSLAQHLENEDGRKFFYSVQISNDEKEDLLVFRAEASAFADNYNREIWQSISDESDRIAYEYEQSTEEAFGTDEFWEEPIEPIEEPVWENENIDWDIETNECFKKIDEVMKRSYIEDFDTSKALLDSLNPLES